MKVLLVGPFPVTPGASGVATACEVLAEHLSCLGAEVTVLSPSDSDFESDHGNGIRVYGIRRQKRLALATGHRPDLLRAASLISKKRLRPSIVHGQGLAGEGLIATRIAKRLEVPCVNTVHGMVDIEARLYRGRPRARLAKAVMLTTLRNADRIILVSPYREAFIGSVTPSRRHLIPNPIAAEFFQRTLTTTRADQLLYVGFIGPRKRIEDVVSAFGYLRATRPGLNLRLVGPIIDRDYFGQIADHVSSLGLAASTTFVGELGRAELAAEYRRSKALLLASEEENAPQVLAEAMACGLPAVATDVGAVAWMIEDGKNGFVVPARDPRSLAERAEVLLSDPGLWSSMSSAAQYEAVRFEPSRVAQQTLGVYEDALRVP